MNKKTRVCVVSPEIVGPHKNGGIGTHCYYLSAFLSQHLKQEVTVFHTGHIEQRNELYWRDWFKKNLGIHFVSIRPRASQDTVPAGLKSHYGQIARAVYNRVREGNFEVCHFQEMLGNGFRCFQAKRLGLAFQNTILTCTVHSSWEWICQAMQSFPQLGFEELQTKYMERYCIENSDLLISPSDYMLNWLDTNQVKTPARRQVLPYLFDPELRRVGYKPAANHIIFFGRLEVRKGLLLFLQALLDLDRHKAFAGQPVQVTFLGKSGYTPDGGGRESIEKFRRKFSSAIRLSMVNDLGHRQALKFLIAHNDALVVCPSLVDNSPYAIIESLQLGLNIIAARSGGIPELFAGAERLFEPEPAALAAKIKAGLQNELGAPAKRYDLELSQRLWGDFCEKLLPPADGPHPLPGPRSAPSAKVQVFVGAGSSQQGLTSVLQGMEGQKYQNFDLTVVPAGEEPEKLSPELLAFCRTRGWQILDAPPSGSGPAGAQLPAECPYALFLAPGCSPAPQTLGQLVQSMEHCPGLDALTCFTETVSESNGKAAVIYDPLGPCLEGGLFHNVFGAGCLLLRTARLPQPLPALEKLLQPEGIWAYLAGLTLAGKSCDVVPVALAVWKNAKGAVSFTDVDYARFLPLLDTYSVGQPIWMRYLFLHAVASERRLITSVKELREREEEIRVVENLNPVRVAYKIRRETKRILRQCQSLFRRE